MTKTDNKRIAKNTFLLYTRMLILLLLSFYTSRIILQTLGVEDYGIYNAVGGIVALFGFLNNSMSVSTQRFLTVALGKGDKQQITSVFSSSVHIHIIIAIIVLILGETIGLWFLYHKMQIPAHRMSAAFWTLQASIGTAIVMVSGVPYYAAIIAYERMSAFAYISIIEAGLKLAIVYVLLIGEVDKLILYAGLIFAIQILIRNCYAWYCQHHFPTLKHRLIWDQQQIKEMSSFAAWGLLGNFAFILNTQGVNLLLNFYFGVVANAARGIAIQVDGALKQFVTSFTMAVNPQITKSYALHNFERMHSLIFSSARFSVFLMAILTIPVLLDTDFVLRIWLKSPPEYATTFLQWSILISFLDPALSNSSLTAIIATGKLKRYQLIVTCIGTFIFLLSWLAFYLGYPPVSTFVIYFVIHWILQFVRLLLLKKMIALPIRRFIREVILKVSFTIVLICIPSYLISQILNEGYLRFIAIALTSLFCSIFAIYFVGLNSKEQAFILEKVKYFQQKNKMKIPSFLHGLLTLRPRINITIRQNTDIGVLNGRCALITGGTSGIGLAIAERFLKAGCYVIITGRNNQRLHEACEHLKSTSNTDNILGIILDNCEVSNFEVVFKKLQTNVAEKKWPRIDILVNNAGVNGQVMPDVTEEQYDKIINTNLKSVFFLSQMFGKYLIKHQLKGNILNIGSASGIRPANSPYILSKWGVRALTLGLAKSLASHGITVNGIAPGPTVTPMLNKKDTDDLSLLNLPLGRYITTAEVSEMAVILVSDTGRSVMGDIVYMTGGAGVLTYDDIPYQF